MPAAVRAKIAPNVDAVEQHRRKQRDGNPRRNDVHVEVLASGLASPAIVTVHEIDAIDADIVSTVVHVASTIGDGCGTRVVARDEVGAPPDHQVDGCREPAAA